MADALIWARIIDDRLAVENANAWSYWRLIGQNTTNNEGLMNAGGAVAKHAYVLGQYSRFVRPGYYRIHATHSPQADIYVSAYKHSQTNTLTIVAINNSNAGVSQTFFVSHAPSFQSLRVYVTDPTRNIAPQPSVAVHDNSFSFTLPAYSVTTFTGQAGSGRGPTPDTRVRPSGAN
jgi:glucuronoarabinoxylan endo-1,4-beta-xylanase